MSKRADVHSHSSLKPDDYTWVGYSDEGDQHTDRLTDGPLFVFGVGEEQTALRKECNPSGVRNEIHPGGCDACGQQGLRYRHYFRHDPTGDVIVLGDQCVARMDFPSQEAFKAAKKVAEIRKQQKIDQERVEWEKENEDAAKWLNSEAPDRIRDHGIRDFMLDLRSSLRRYGGLTENQVTALKVIKKREEEFAARRKEQEEKDDRPKAPVPVTDERIEISGDLLSVKEKVYDDESIRFVMTVRDDRGFKVWGTIPEKLIEDLFRKHVAPDLPLDDPTFREGAWVGEVIRVLRKGKEMRCQFNAKIEPSDDDETFGFFKRPTKPKAI